MAPVIQEPPISTEEKIEQTEYIGTMGFNVTRTDKGTVTYTVMAESEKEAKSIIDDLIYKDFSFDGLVYTLKIAVVESPTQKATSKSRIKKLQQSFLDDKELQYIQLNKQNIKIKFNGELKTIPEIRKALGLKKNSSVVEDIVVIEPEQKVKTVEVSPKVVEKKEIPVWFCEYNIKIGEERFRKGTKIEKVDNEIDARKQLDIFIKKTFSRVRSVTKVKIERWDGNKEEFSDLIESAITTQQSSQKIEPIVKTLDDMINENFSEDDLNEKCIQIVLKPTKIRPKDFDDGFLVYPDEGQTDDELFEEMKKDVIHLKKKNFATKRVRFRNILTTTQYKRMINSQLFRDAVAETHNGFDGLEAASSLTKEFFQKKLDGLKADLTSLMAQTDMKGFSKFA